MSRIRRISLVGVIAVLALLMLPGCALQTNDRGGQPAGNGWYIRLNVRAPTAPKAITVNECPVTALAIEVRDPDDAVLQTIDWQVAQGPKSYVVPVQQQGEYDIEVTHIGSNNGVTVQVAENATFNIQAMMITVIDIVPGGIGAINVKPGEGGGGEAEYLISFKFDGTPFTFAEGVLDAPWGNIPFGFMEAWPSNRGVIDRMVMMSLPAGLPMDTFDPSLGLGIAIIGQPVAGTTYDFVDGYSGLHDVSYGTPDIGYAIMFKDGELGTGTVTVTKAEGLGGVIEGTFSATVREDNAARTPHSISDGAFRVKWVEPLLQP